MLDHGKLKQMAMAVWQRGGLDTLVKVMPYGSTPNAAYPVGYCTTLKYILGRSPVQMESIVGLAKATKLAQGAEVFTIDPLPAATEFDLKGYSQTPAGVATNDPAYKHHPGYPPGEGVPQWDLARVPQSRLVHLASVPTGQAFRLTALPP
jgi:hypothetical protein